MILVCSLPANRWKKALNLVKHNEHAVLQKRICGEILHLNNVQKLEESFMLSYPFYYIIRNIMPVCHQVFTCFIFVVVIIHM